MIYDISYKISIGSKPLRIKFDKIDGFITVYDGTRYLTLFGEMLLETYKAISTKIEDLKSIELNALLAYGDRYGKIKKEHTAKKFILIFVA